MTQLFSNDYFIYVIIFFAGVVAYIISTLSGGGGSLLLVPVMNFFIGARATPPVINLGNWIYGMVIGIGASAGNWIGKTFLKKISSKLFRVFVIIIMVGSGLALIAKQVNKLFSLF